MRVALAQMNSVVGDIEGNAARILRSVETARGEGAALVVFPELAVFGYPPQDLLLRRDLVRRNVEAVEQIAACCREITAVVGFVQPDPSGTGKGIYNAAAICAGGTVTATYAKMLLPTYDVFDEWRHFNAGRQVCVAEIRLASAAKRIGLSICEDLWNDEQFEGRKMYGVDPIEMAVRANAQVLVNLSASPFRVGKIAQRERLFARQAQEHRMPLVYVNAVGGNDDLVFDGASMVFDAEGHVSARAKAFDEDLLIVEIGAETAARCEPYPGDLESIHRALVLGTRDYLTKCGFREAVIGLSGGIDSAVTAVIAAEALGVQAVHGVAMPSRFSSTHSVEDAKELARRLNIDFRIIPIEAMHQSFEQALRPAFAGQAADLAEENLQARIRGNIVMALSNKFGWLPLTTGNKSELAVGYCTLYGDMCGGLAVISDVPKTMVCQLARHINTTDPRKPIPQRTIDKPPSAELRENQTDQDTLPPYEVLDAILELHVEQDVPAAEIVARGFDAHTVNWVLRMVERSEYKRKQAAIGIKVTSRAFGSGRRMPIAARFQ